MRDQDLRAQLAAMQASLRHIEVAVDKADRDRNQMDDKLDGVTERVTRLEGAMPSRDDVTANVAHHEADEARRTERERAGDNLRATVPAVVAVLSLIVATLALGVDILP